MSSPKIPTALLLPAIGLGVFALLPAARSQQTTEAPKLTPEQSAFFESKVRPLLAKQCYPCHGDGRGSGGLTLDTRGGWLAGGNAGPAIVPGDTIKSVLLQRVHGTRGAQMPPGQKLSAEELATLDAWVKMGAPDPRVPAPGAPGRPATSIRLSGLNDKARGHWAFQSVEKPAIPKPKNATLAKAWVKNPIDSFVLARLETAGLSPAPAASRAALIRRVTYDLTGMPPTVDEVRAFLADKSPDAYEKVVDRLLSSPRYGERWARHWLDSARYSDTTGNTQNGKNRFADFRYANAWTYRDWTVRALNSDMPYNKFLMAQLAADKLPEMKDDPSQLAALGFLTVGKRFNDENDQIDERIDTVTKATMGVTLSCARCHDHPFDPIPSADYYALHGIFASIDEPEVGPEIPGSGDPNQRSDYETQRNVLLARGRDAYFYYIQEKNRDFQANASAFLQLRTANPRSKEGAEIAQKYNVNLNRDRILIQSLRPTANDPVLGPLARLSRVNDAQFPTAGRAMLAQMLGTGPTPTAARRGRGGRFQPASNAGQGRAMAGAVPNLNPIVARELAAANPKSFADVCDAYGRIFERSRGLTAAYLEAMRAGQPSPVDGATAQLLAVPFGVPEPSAFQTSEGLRQAAARFSGDNRAAARFPLDEINRLDLTHPGAPGHAMVVEDIANPRDSRLLIRGEKTRAADVIPRRAPLLCLPTGSAAPSAVVSGSGRLELARAIASSSNPLTARTLVNRVWMYHFGQGFVRTPDDIGNQSERPSHPELLDWLAAHFTENGWSLKKLHRWIVTSSAYRQSSTADSATQAIAQGKDPGNRLLWRANLRRLDFESIRDTMVSLTGKMDPAVGGKPVNITDEPYIYRRSVYGYIDRLQLSDLLTQFDVSDPTVANTERISTIVPQQALFFMNSPMSIDVARQVIGRPEVQAATTDAAKVAAIYLILYQRSPRPDEIALASKFLAQSLPDTAAPGAPGVGPARRRPQKTQQQAGMRGGKYAPIVNNTARVERGPLSPWEQYAQALLLANEFVYVN